MHTRTEMLELVVVDGKARGIVVRDLVTGEISTDVADAVVLATGGYGNVFFLSTNAMGCNVTATWRAYKQGGATSPTPATRRSTRPASRSAGDHQSKLTLMSESLRNDGRVWVPKKQARRPPARPRSPRPSATTTSSGSTRASATWPRATSPRAPPRKRATRAAASAPAGSASTSTSPTPSSGSGRRPWRRSTATCSTCTSRSPARTPYKRPMRIYPAVHYTMGGLWVDYNLMSNIPGLFVTRRGELLRPRREPPRRLGAHAGPGRRLLRAAVHDLGNYLADGPFEALADGPRGRGRRRQGGRRPDRAASSASRASAPWTPSTANWARSCGTTAAWRAPTRACARPSARSASCKEEFWSSVSVPGSGEALNQELEKAGRVADFLEFGELMCIDALHRNESCGGHFREENQTEDGEAKRDDENFPTSPRGSSRRGQARPPQGSPRVRRGKPQSRCPQVSDHDLKSVRAAASPSPLVAV